MNNQLLELHALKTQLEIQGCWYLSSIIGKIIERDYGDKLRKE